MDISSLLAPIDVDRPGGDDLSFSPEVDAIQEMRREDDPTLDQGEWVSALKSADWAGVVRSCESILATKSKDLRVAGWLVDGWARLRAFEGLADGLDLTAGLIDAHWDHLHPLPDDGDEEQRIGNLRWLAARVEQLAPTIALVVHGGRRFTLGAIAGARARRLLGQASGAGAGSLPDGAVTSPTAPALTLEAVLRDVSAGGRDAARARRTDASRARAGLERLQTAVNARLRDDAPSFVAPRAALDRVLDELGRLERECGFSEATFSASTAADGDHDESSVSTAEGVPASSPVRMPSRIDTRAQAIDQLRLVAAFFRATEPHSPVAYLADKAVRWSEMPLHEWLRTVVKDGVSLAHLEEILGVDRKPEDAG